MPDTRIKASESAKAGPAPSAERQRQSEMEALERYISCECEKLVNGALGEMGQGIYRLRAKTSERLVQTLPEGSARPNEAAMIRRGLVAAWLKVIGSDCGYTRVRVVEFAVRQAASYLPGDTQS